METLRSALRQPALGVTSDVLVLIFAVFLFPRFDDSYREASDPHIAELQLSWSVERFDGIVDDWVRSRGNGAIEGVKREIVVLDFAFTFVYAVFGSVMLAVTWPADAWRSWLLALPLVAAVSDWIENVFILLALSSYGAYAAASAGLTIVGMSAFASTKFIFSSARCYWR